MNFYLSLFLYNPLEAFVLIIFCSMFSYIKINKNIVRDCYMLGSINLFIQYLNKIFTEDIIILVYDTIVSLFLMPLVLFIFLNFNNYNIKFYTCICSCIFNFLTIFVGLMFTDTFCIFEVYFNIKRSIQYEVFVNLIIKILQLFTLILIRYGVIKLKKILKFIANKNTEKAFTAMQHYQPKLPKALMEKIEKNK